MTKQTEALKLALEALEFSKPAWAGGVFLDERKAKHTAAITALREALAEQPAQLDPSAGTQVSKVWWDGEKLMAKQISLEGIYKPAQQEPPTEEPIRIFDYVWPQRDEHKEECVYACSYTPGHHLARGELLAVVHPSQLKNAYSKMCEDPLGSA
jgi:hypothetical protein